MERDQHPDDIAVIGIGCLFPKAASLADYWRNIAGGVDCITDLPATHWRPEDYTSADRAAPDMTYARRGGFLDPYPFSPLAFGISPSAIEATDTSQLLGMVVAHQALVDAGYGPGAAFDRDRVSVIMGVTGTLELAIPLGARLGHPVWKRALRDAGVDDDTARDVVERIAASYVGWQEASFPGLLGNVVAGRIANRLDLGGTNCVVDAACASALSALHLAVMELRSGRADMVVTGGVDTFNDIFMYMCFSKTPALSPTGDARPFSRTADGTILGEGIGCVLLKRLADAERDGDRVYAVVKSIGTASDGKGQAIYAPSATGQAKALRAAYTEARVTPAEVELIEAHGTGTKVGDEVELTALRAVYGDAPLGAWCAVGSVKSQIGHTKAAAGVAGLIKAVMALHHRVLPPTLKVAEPAAALAGSPFYVLATPRPWVRPPLAKRRAAVSAFGFGGSNFHCVLEEGPTRSRDVLRMDGDVQILAFSGPDAPALAAQLAAANAVPLAAWEAVRHLGQAARGRFDAAAAYRLCLVISRGDDVAQRLKHAARRLEEAAASADHWQERGLWFDRRAGRPVVAGLFPGQGSQYPGMLRDLAGAADTVMAALDHAEELAAAAEPPLSARLSTFIYPLGSAAPDRADALARLTATGVAQPALAAVSAGALALIRALGVPLSLAAGHSFGELTALHAAGTLPLADYLRLALVRGELMSRAGDGERGTMLAVAAGYDHARAVLERGCDGVTIANDNGPKQVVVAGSIAAVARAAAAFAAQGIGTRALNVSAAFHSVAVEGAVTPFAAALADVAFAPATLPVYANATALPYPEATAAAQALLASQLIRPVRFVDVVRGLYAAGARVFLEIGPGRTLGGLTAAVLTDLDGVTVLSLDASCGGASGLVDLASALAALAARGVAVHLGLWDATYQAQPAPVGLIVPLSGANYRKPVAAVPPRPPQTRAGTEAAPGLKAPFGTTPAAPPRALPAPVAAAARPVAPKVPSAPRRLAAPEVRSVPMPPPTADTKFIREAILALQQMQLQTAGLHRQFLEGQRVAQAQVFALVGSELGLDLEHADAGMAGEGNVAAAAVEPVVAPPSPYVAPLPYVEPLSYVAPLPYVAPLSYAAPGPNASAPSALPQAAPTPRALVSARPVAGALETQPRPTSAAPALAAAPPAQTLATLLAVVAEKTGYPEAMLDLGMSLESDLGIDSIKRVEIMSELQSRLPAAQVLAAEDLTRLATLREIADALAGAAAPSAPAAAPPAALGSAACAPAMADGTQAAVLAVIAEKTGYPAEMLGLGMSLESDLGIDSIKRVEIFSELAERLPAARALGSERMLALNTVDDIVACLAAAGPAADAVGAAAPPTPAANAAGTAALPMPAVKPPGLLAAAYGAVTGVDRFVLATEPLPAVGAPTLLAGDGAPALWIAAEPGDGLAAALAAELTAAGFQPTLVPLDEACPAALPAALRGLIIVAPAVPQAPRALTLAAFAVAQRAGRALRPTALHGGALFATVTRLGGDFGLGGVDSLSTALLGGLGGLAKTASHEWPDVRCRALDIDPRLADAAAGAVLAAELLGDGPTEVGLGVGGRVGLRLRHEDVAAQPEAAPLLAAGDLIVVTGGARGVTAAVCAHLAAVYHPALLVLGRSPAPLPEAAATAALTGEAELKAALFAAAATPLSPRELQLAYTQLMAARELTANLQRFAAAGATVRYASVDVRDAAATGAAVAAAVAVHGAVRGIVHGAGVLADKLIEEKTAAAFATVYDTKIAGLTGVLAAADPAALRFAALFSSSTGRFGRKGQADYAVANEALNKVAQYYATQLPACRFLALNWGPWDGGMVTSGLKALFRDEGVEVIGLADGAAYLAAELAAQPLAGPRELVLLGRPARRTGASAQAPAAALREVFTLSVDPVTYPVLGAHVLNGRAVVPAALLLEWLALAAVQRHAGLAFVALAEFRVLKGITMAAGGAVAVHAVCGAATAGDCGAFYVPVELHGLDAAGRRLTFARGTAQLCAGARPLPSPSLMARPGGAPARDVRLAYADDLFHGELLHGISAIFGCDDRGIAAQVASTCEPTAWGPMPLRRDWITQPLAIDCCMQLLVLWCRYQREAPCLPSGVGRYEQFVPAFPPGGCEVRLEVTDAAPGRVVATAELLSGDQVLARLRGLTGTVDPALRHAFAARRLAPAAVAAVTQ